MRIGEIHTTTRIHPREREEGAADRLRDVVPSPPRLSPPGPVLFLFFLFLLIGYVVVVSIGARSRWRPPSPPVAGAPNHATDEVEETEGTAAGSWLTPFLILGSSRPPLPVALKPPSVGAVSRTCSNLAGVKASKKGHRRHCGVAAARAPLWCRKSRRPSTRSLF